MSTFDGLEMAKQALFAQQSALYTTSHNISNANTDGYTRQRVNFETSTSFPPSSRNGPEIAGQRGTGVETGSIQRVRNQFLDNQYRTENSSSGYWGAKSDALERVENVMNEPSDTGLSAVMDDFWKSLEDVSTNPDDSGARSVAAQRGQAVAETFNFLSDSLNTIKEDLNTQIGDKVNEVNSIASQIDTINDQVKKAEANGQLPNDLYDKRDNLIDDLSGIVDIQVEYEGSSEGAPKMADGLAKINLVNNDETVLVKGKTNDDQGFNEISETPGEDGDISIKEFTNSEGDIIIPVQKASPNAPTGSLKGLVESSKYVEDDMLGDLDDLANTFASAFNEVHKDGVNLKGQQGTDKFFKDESDKKITAGSITINESIVNSPDKIAAAESNNAGDGDNAQDLADIFDTSQKDLDDDSINGFYQSMIGEMGVTAQEANNKADNTETLRSQVETQRQSVGSVSLDEEMANMVEFQHAYNAAARSMTAVDEMLDRVINNMGLVGR
ncbi:flagellar hook-associated protein FlgK [Barrientosiimonas marina]|uniref:Flagellar hook-associated protein 1 n=1 Tax=Lentibacillus kimchii TaxID=1542911 RepID=A0ABW2UYX1_9BACI